MNVFTQALIYSCIAFSIVFIVLAGLTLMIYTMRLFTGDESGSSSGGAPDVKQNSAVKAEARPAASAPAADVKSQHVAAVTAAILTATRGRGRILSVTPVERIISSESTKIWKTAAVMAAANRRLSPSWKR